MIRGRTDHAENFGKVVLAQFLTGDGVRDIRDRGGETAQRGRNLDEQCGTGGKEEFVACRRLDQIAPADRHARAGERDFEVESLLRFRNDFRGNAECGGVAAEHCE